MQALTDWLRRLWPERSTADARERLRVVVGAAMGILLTGLITRWSGVDAWLIAPMGATAVLVFAVPGSPMAQPWAVVAGNTLSALVGVACVHLFRRPELAAAAAVGSAIGLMMLLRCLHPPGGASALLMALGGTTDPAFVLDPVLLNAVLMTLAGLVFNPLTGRAYPHRPAPASSEPDARDEDAALDAVLARYNRVLDIGRDELRQLLHDARWQAHQQQLDRLRCGDIMSRRLVTATRDTGVTQALELLLEHRIKALPVLDAHGALVGIVTRADLLRADDEHRVADVMTRQVRVAGEQRHLAELIPLFASTGHHHIPIVDAQGRLVGMVTQSDVVAALASQR